MKAKRVDMKAILGDPDLRRKLMVPVIQATQAREGIETTPEQADRAYYVIAEAQKTAFFSLSSHRTSKGLADGREEAFVHALRGVANEVRFDVARTDFAAIDGAPLAYRRIGLVAHIFREASSLEQGWADARVGLSTEDDTRFVRFHWEPSPDSLGTEQDWWCFAKGGGFSRFHQSFMLVVLWKNCGEAVKHYNSGLYGKGGSSRQVRSEDCYGRPGLTWPRAGGYFSVRRLPAGCIFADKGPAIFPERQADSWFLLGVLNSSLAEYMLAGLTSREEMGARWEVGVIKRLPVPHPGARSREIICTNASFIHDAKAAWDSGNEVSTHFAAPWLLSPPPLRALGVFVVPPQTSLPQRLDALDSAESSEDVRIQRLCAELNDEVYRLYGIPDPTRKTIEDTLGERPPELIWPQLAKKTAEQKRMEHVWRLLSYCVKRVVEADDDGVVPFAWSSREPSLIERVRLELHQLFPALDPNQLEVDINNELKRKVKGYRTCSGIQDWLENAFFEYHCDLYKSRPIFWHIASAQGTSRFAFGVLVHYHRFDKNRMAKLRASYIRDAIEEFRREAGLADKAGRPDDRTEWQGRMEETQALDKRLQSIQEGFHEGPEGGDRDVRILTPWKDPATRPKGWDPDLDDGVKVNIEPLEKAGVLRKGKVT